MNQSDRNIYKKYFSNLGPSTKDESNRRICSIRKKGGLVARPFLLVLVLTNKEKKEFRTPQENSLYEEDTVVIKRVKSKLESFLFNKPFS